MTRSNYTNPGLSLLVTCAALLLPAAASGTLVHSGDSTIQGGLCVGFDCASNEPMGFATIKIEENNLRIAAADSSTVSGFPTRDWQIEFNSSSSGGGSYFMVRDCGNGGAAGSVDSTCGGTPMLTIEGGADNESIHVDSSGNQGGNVGFGTAVPVVDLHALSGNTPTLRLEQDNSSGFTPQSWDLAGNESNFFIRDVTNGSALPFRIEPGTASNTLYLDNNENVGIRTTAPTVPLHVVLSGGSFGFNASTAMGIQNTNNAGDGVILSLVGGTGGNSQIALGDSNDEFAGRLSYNHVNDTMRFFTNGAERMTLDSAGNLVINGTCTSQAADCATDYVLHPDYPLESIEEHATAMRANSYLPAVGPTPDNQGKSAEIRINVFQKTIGILAELEKAHLYIEQLHERVVALERALEAATPTE